MAAEAVAPEPSPDEVEPPRSIRGRIGQTLSDWRRLGRIAYRDPEHVAERLTLYGARNLGDPSLRRAHRVREARPEVPSAVIAEELRVFAMALTMTVPMVAWMRYRGHSGRANIEMAASMLIPTFAVMVVLWAGAAKGTLMVPEHAGMLACMLVAMLLRRDEYSCATHHNRHPHPAVVA